MIRIRAKEPHGFDVWLDVPSLDDIAPTVRELLAKGYTPVSSGRTRVPGQRGLVVSLYVRSMAW
jgi:hypothetical protein